MKKSIPTSLRRKPKFPEEFQDMEKKEREKAEKAAKEAKEEEERKIRAAQWAREKEERDKEWEKNRSERNKGVSSTNSRVVNSCVGNTPLNANGQRLCDVCLCEVDSKICYLVHNKPVCTPCYEEMMFAAQRQTRIAGFGGAWGE